MVDATSKKLTLTQLAWALAMKRTATAMPALRHFIFGTYVRCCQSPTWKVGEASVEKEVETAERRGANECYNQRRSLRLTGS